MSLTNLIKQDYYINYKGPNLTVANIWKKGQEKEDITDHIKTFYGENNNWNQKLYTYGEILPNKNNLYHFYVEFQSDNGRKHWFHGIVGGKNQFFNPPLASPFNEFNNQ